jgi:MFS family permease
VASLLLMGVCTTLIGVLPGYATIGAWAPILLCVLRFGQGLGLGGEWGGAALAGHRKRAQGQARLVRHVPAAGAFHWLSGGQWAVPDRWP